MDPYWILAIRHHLLTEIFKIFPFFASDYFYITCIAFGYWLSLKRPVFINLGFLIPFSTLVNCLLKNLFRIPRPDEGVHLIKIYDSFGFPSGDVQVAVVFWGMLMIHCPTNILRSLCLASIIGISFSRMYLGVHSIYDVIGGILFGISILYIWNKYSLSSLLFKKYKSFYLNYWSLNLFFILTYVLFSQNVRWPPVASMSIGALIGYGFSIPCITNKSGAGKEKKVRTNHILYALSGFAVTIGVAVMMPVIKINELFYHTTIIIKFLIITFWVFTLFPGLLTIFNRKYHI